MSYRELDAVETINREKMASVVGGVQGGIPADPAWDNGALHAAEESAFDDGGASVSVGSAIQQKSFSKLRKVRLMSAAMTI